MRLLNILFLTATPQISAIVLLITCLLSQPHSNYYAIKDIFQKKHNFCFYLKNHFKFDFVFLPARPNPQKTALFGRFHIITKTTIKIANYLILAAFLATLATFPTLAVSDFSPLVNSASSASPIFSLFTAEQQ